MSREEESTWRRAMIVWVGLATLAPVVLIGWWTRGAIEEIQGASRDAVARVEASVSRVAHAQELHEARDEIETAELQRRVGAIEEWQTGRAGRVEVSASAHDAALPVNRRNPRGMP